MSGRYGNGLTAHRNDQPHRRVNRLLRLGRRLHERGNRLGSLLVDAVVRILFSADIPSRMPLPDSVTFMHNGLGTVVDERVVFEGPALVFQHVTLGFAFGSKGGVPRVGSHVVIGAGAVVVGAITLGDGCFVGANCVVTEDVPDGHVVRPPAAEGRATSGEDAKRFW